MRPGRRADDGVCLCGTIGRPGHPGVQVRGGPPAGRPGTQRDREPAQRGWSRAPAPGGRRRSSARGSPGAGGSASGPGSGGLRLVVPGPRVAECFGWYGGAAARPQMLLGAQTPRSRARGCSGPFDVMGSQVLCPRCPGLKRHLASNFEVGAVACVTGPVPSPSVRAPVTHGSRQYGGTGARPLAPPTGRSTRRRAPADAGAGAAVRRRRRNPCPGQASSVPAGRASRSAGCARGSDRAPCRPR